MMLFEVISHNFCFIDQVQIFVKFDKKLTIFTKKNFFFIFDFLAKIFGPSRQLSMPGRFNFMKFLCDKGVKKMSADFSCLFTFFKKNYFSSNFGSIG